MRRGKCPQHREPFVQLGLNEEGTVPIVGCPIDDCDVRVAARKGTALYRALFGSPEPRMLDGAELHRQCRRAIAQMLRDEYPHATLADLAVIAEKYPDLTVGDLLDEE